MDNKVKEFVKKCKNCELNVDKKCTEPIVAHKVPSRNWETVAVDLFGPMPSSKHIVVAYNLASRFPAAKLVTSTKSEKVIPALKDIYDNFGNPQTQISDNGPPFNSVKMEQFSKQRGIHLQKIPPLHPSANPAETFMKTIGKAVKIAVQNNLEEQDILEQTLNTYRQTPHPATSVPPSSMMFRDGIQSTFPRRFISDEDITRAKLNE